jgi:hypothetical protein
MPMWTPAVALGSERKAKPAIAIRRTNNLFIQNLLPLMCHKRRMQAKANACGCDLEDEFEFEDDFKMCPPQVSRKTRTLFAFLPHNGLKRL